MGTYSDHEQRELDQQSGRELDRIISKTKMAQMALALAKARAYVTPYVKEAITVEFREYSEKTLREIDAALDGTIHSFTRNGSAR